jgi:hypothetical protein
MVSTEGEAHGPQRDHVEDILFAFREWLNVQEDRWRSDEGQKEFHLSPSIAAGEPSQYPHRRTVRRPSVKRRVLRTFYCGLFIAAIVGATFAWQSSDDETKDMVRDWGISLAQLSTVLDSRSATNSDAAGEARLKTPDQSPTLDTTIPQKVAVNQSTPPLLAAAPSVVPAELQHQLGSLEDSIAEVKRAVDKLAAAQEQMTQTITTLQSTEQSVVDRMALLSQSSTANVPAHKHSGIISQLPSGHVPGRPAQAPLPLR